MPRSSRWRVVVTRPWDGSTRPCARTSWRSRVAPARPAAYVFLATLAQRQRKDQRAQLVLDDLVKHNPDQADVYLLRARLRLSQGQLTGTEEDLKRYLQKRGAALAPEYLQTLADLASRLGDATSARRAWELALGFRPGDVVLSRGLAQLELEEGHAAEALDWVKRALAAHPEQPDLILVQVEALAVLGQFDAAAAAIDPLRVAAGRSATPFGDAPHGLAGYLDGRLLMVRRAWAEAAVVLEDVTRVEGLAPGLEPLVYLNLGVCREQQGQGDGAASAYRKAAELEPTLTQARLGRARAALRLALAGTGSEDREAEGIIRWAAQEPRAAAGAALLLADLRLARGRSEDAGAAFAEIRQTNGSAEMADLWLAEARWRAGTGDLAESRRVLVRAEAQLGDRVDWRLARLELVAQLPYADAAALVRAEIPEAVGSARFLGLFLERAAAKRPAVAWPFLQAAADHLLGGPPLVSLPVRDQVRLLRQAALALVRLGEIDEAARLRRRLAALELPDLPSAVLLLDVALEDGDETAAAAAVDRLDRLGAKGLGYAQVGRAARLILRYRAGDESALAPARQLLEQVPADAGAAARAGWLKAVLDDLAGHADAALTGYLAAAQRGEIRLALLMRVVALLRERRRFAEADRFFEQAERALVLRGGLARLAADTALRAGRPERAALLARRGVSPAMGSDGAIWLGQFLDRAGQPRAAERVLREAAEKATTMNPWVALVAHLAAAGQLEEAAAERARLAARLPPEEQALALALCDEVLGHWTEAAGEYEKAAAAARPAPERARACGALSTCERPSRGRRCRTCSLCSHRHRTERTTQAESSARSPAWLLVRRRPHPTTCSRGRAASWP